MDLTIDTKQTRAVSDLLDRFVRSWNDCDLNAMDALCTDRVHWVNTVGMHWRGRAQVDRAHRVYFDRMFRGVPLALEEIESIEPLAGDFVIVVARLWKGAFRQPDGVEAPPSRDRMTMVLQPGPASELLIRHAANVGIVEAAQRFDPAAA